MRERSVWAWGWRDKLPDEATRKGLAALAKAILPNAQPALRELPSEEPAIGRERALHARGRAFPDLVRGFAGDFAGAPAEVVYPTTTEEVERVFDRGVPVIPFGGGTSVAGGLDASALDGAISLDLAKLSGVYEIDATSRLARIGAGTLGPDLEAGLAPHGFTLRHFPQSFEFSTLGGWLATRAGGHYATGPTHIDDHCHALTMVTPRGALTTHPHPASGAGPEPLRMIVGSEGALGAITEAWMRIVPKPEFRAAASVAYARFDDAVAAARALAQSGLMPSNCRLLDATEARLHRVRFDGQSVLLVAFESADHPVDAWLARAVELCRDSRGEVSVKKDAGAWKQAFFDAPYLQSQLLSIGVLADTFETACSWTQFPALHQRVTSAVQAALDAECGGGAVACRFTHVYPDGPAPYYTFLGALRIGDELAQWRAIKAAASDALAAAGGTITHHHAVGRTHKPWYERERPPLFGAALAAVKRELDPRGVCNPGVLV